MADDYPGKVTNEHVKRKTKLSPYLRKLNAMYRKRAIDLLAAEQAEQDSAVVVSIDEKSRKRTRRIRHG
jgi:hypothetical protein